MFRTVLLVTRQASDFRAMLWRLLTRTIFVIGCTAMLLLPMQSIPPFGAAVALADDDGGDDGGGDDGGGDDGGGDDGGDDDGNDGDGTSFGSDRSSSSVLEKRQRAIKARQARQAPRAVRIAPRPERVRFELVALGLDADARARLIERGYRVLDESTLRAQQGQIVVRLRVPRGISIEAARAEVRALSGAPTADLNHYYRPQLGEDCRNASCESWSLISWTGAEEAECQRHPVIGIVDTGINTLHEALRGSDIEAFSLLRDGLKPSGKQHGTAVAALIAGAPGTRAPGLLPEARIIAVDPFHQGENADNRVDIYDLVRAVDLLVSRSPDAINLSLAGPPNLLLEQSVAAAMNAGIPVIAAVGNDGPRARPSYPAGYEGVIAVTALDRKLAVYRRAGQGEHVDFAAPGVGVWTAAAMKGVRRSSGTSFAAPFVTAAAALLKAADPGIGVDELQRRLAGMSLDLGREGRDTTFGAGLIRGAPACSGTNR